MDFFKNIFSNKEPNVFNEFDTENYRYQILIRNIRHENSKSIYFLDDQLSIKKLSKKWKLPLADSVCRGGYDYSISIFRDNELEQLSLVCFKCDSWSIQESNNSEKGLFKISQEKFQHFLHSHFNEIEIREYKFSAKEEALVFWEKEKNNQKLIRQHQLLPDWMRFEGEYTLNFYLKEANNRINQKEYIENTIKSFGDCGEYEFFQIVASGNAEGYNYTFIIKSSKKLFDKFDQLFPEMLLKNNSQARGFFDKDWSGFDDFSMQLYYRK